MKVKISLLMLAAVLLARQVPAAIDAPDAASVNRRTPVIYSTDLLHPHEDPDDHFDLACLYAMPEVDLRAVILDNGAAQAQRPGTVPVRQLNWLTGRRVPSAVGLLNPLKSPDDLALDQPAEHQGGVRLLLETLRDSQEKVAIVFVGSARDTMAAFNREPALFRAKVRSIHGFIGEASDPKFIEYNVSLDPNAFVGLFRSGLPLYWIPCFDGGLWQNNGHASYWKIRHREVLENAPEPILKYFMYMLRKETNDPIAYLSLPISPEDRQWLMNGERNLWASALLGLSAGRTVRHDGRDGAGFSPVNLSVNAHGVVSDASQPDSRQIARFVITDHAHFAAAATAATARLLAAFPIKAAFTTGDSSANRSALPKITATDTNRFHGKFFSGSGDMEYLELLDLARRMFAPDPELQNLSMLYMPSWNGLVEGPTWDAWWIQNSYGTTYCALPFFQEPFLTFLRNSHDLWFSQMGDGKRVGAAPPFNWIAPDGCLCDAARPGWAVYKQGDGRTAIHDWGMEFTAAGLLMQAELLLISRDQEQINASLPQLERCAEFIETRRDPANNLFFAGPAGNLLAPSYAGWKRPDGSYGQAYLTGLSVTYIAASERLAEVQRLAGKTAAATVSASRRASARRGLAELATDEGYFIRSLDPDGVRHGVFASDRHGYFEAAPNHDAICFRVVDDAQAESIMAKIESIPGLRPHGFILPNYPSYDDMYEKPEGLWAFGTWVNGGHWSTCEARMIMGYYRLGRFEDVRRSMKHLMTFARKFRMDNPLVKFGSEVYQPREPINLTYDAFGPAAALVRGLFDYRYSAEGLTLVPQIPPTITELRQQFPIRFGQKRLFLGTAGKGRISQVLINGKPWSSHDATGVFLPYDTTPDSAEIWILLGNAGPRKGPLQEPVDPERLDLSNGIVGSSIAELEGRSKRLERLHRRLINADLGATYEAAHAQLACDSIRVVRERRSLLRQGQLKPLPDVSQAAADKLYLQTAVRLCDGLDALIATYAESKEPRRKTVYSLSQD